jgi:hypothetical protein
LTLGNGSVTERLRERRRKSDPKICAPKICAPKYARQKEGHAITKMMAVSNYEFKTLLPVHPLAPLGQHSNLELLILNSASI